MIECLPNPIRSAIFDPCYGLSLPFLKESLPFYSMALLLQIVRSYHIFTKKNLLGLQGADSDDCKCPLDRESMVFHLTSPFYTVHFLVFMKISSVFSPMQWNDIIFKALKTVSTITRMKRKHRVVCGNKMALIALCSTGGRNGTSAGVHFGPYLVHLTFLLGTGTPNQKGKVIVQNKLSRNSNFSGTYRKVYLNISIK
jgi:hypothetical protein